ncbi:MAG: tetraacyldisaccharide 4'-kinase [Terracidiphilus sp.]|jgi:tetraacyldisaccharide 4'-kinase
MSPASRRRRLLSALVPAYRVALLLREMRLGTRLEPVRRLRWPVISIGNLSTGGAGKTPLTVALAKALMLRGCHVDVLSRGYGRTSSHPARVDPEGTAEHFGDEPLLIARKTGVPVYVGRQRFLAGTLAEAEASERVLSADALAIHLLDDGFQHRQLYRDVDILLLDGHDWLEEGLLPAGNLREPVEAARRATIIAIPAPDDAPEMEASLRAWGFAGPVWRLHRRMQLPSLGGMGTGPVCAFCGIARPEQFFAGLEEGGLHIGARIAFPDHHSYTEADLERLLARAERAGATALITTEKDLVRLGSLASAIPESLLLKTAGLQVEIENQNEAIDWLIARAADV